MRRRALFSIYAETIEYPYTPSHGDSLRIHPPTIRGKRERGETAVKTINLINPNYRLSTNFSIGNPFFKIWNRVFSLSIIYESLRLLLPPFSPFFSISMFILLILISIYMHNTHTLFVGLSFFIRIKRYKEHFYKHFIIRTFWKGLGKNTSRSFQKKSQQTRQPTLWKWAVKTES